MEPAGGSGGCGRPGHAADCDCNVHPFDVPIASIVGRIAKDMGDLGREDIAQLVWAMHASLPMYDEAMAHPRHGPGFDSYSARRQRLTGHLLVTPAMAELHEDDDACQAHVQMRWEHVLQVVRGKANVSKPPRTLTWDGLDWYAIDTAVAAGDHPNRTLAREMNVGISTLQGLWRLYGRG